MPPSGPTRPIGLLPAFCVLALPLVVGAFVSSGQTWGWDHLHRAGLVWRCVVLAAAVMIWINPVRRRLERAAEAAGALIAREPLRFPILLSLAGLALFAAFPIATRIYGDSRYILDDHTNASLAVHVKKMLSFGLQSRGSGSFVLHDLLSRATGLSYESAYKTVSVLCGGIFLLAHSRLAGKTPGLFPSARAIILWLGLTDGANQLFFGHIENYTVPRLFACLFLIEVVRSLLDREASSHRLRTLLWLFLAVFFHAQWLILVPTAALWLGQEIARGRPGLRPWAGRRTVAIGIAAALVLAVIAYIAVGSYCYNYIYSGGRPHPRQLFLPITTACVGAPYLRYTLFSSGHIADLFGSLYSISSPAVLLAIALFLPFSFRIGRAHGLRPSPPQDDLLLAHPRPTARDERIYVLIPAIVFGFMHNFMLNSAIGFPFDWDLMCILSPPLLYTAVFLIARAGKEQSSESRYSGEDDRNQTSASIQKEAERHGVPFPAASIRSLVPALFVLGFGTLTLFGVNASLLRAYHRVEDMGIWLHKTYYGGSHYRISSNLSAISDPVVQVRERARVLARLMPDVYPDDGEVSFLWERLALERVKLEDYAGAKDAFETAVRIQPSRWQLLKPLGYLETEIGDLQRGMRLLNEYLAKAPADPEGWLFLGNAEDRAGLADEARRSWSRFIELVPDSPEAARVREQLRRAERGIPPSPH